MCGFNIIPITKMVFNLGGMFYNLPYIRSQFSNGVVLSKTKVKVVRKPVQSRGIARFEKILSVAKSLIAEQGMQETTAYKIAEYAELPAASIYQYFPTRELIFETLAERQFEVFMDDFQARFKNKKFTAWQQMAETLVLASYEFYSLDKTNARLFLGVDAIMVVRKGAASRLSRFAIWFCAQMEEQFCVDATPLREPIAISINLIDGAFIRSLSLHEEIQAQYHDEALKAVLGYLSSHLPPSLSVK